MPLNRRCVFVFGWLVSTACPTVLAAQASPSPSLDSLQRAILDAPTDSAAGAALERALFALQASNRLADTLLTLAATGRDYRTVVFGSLGLIPYHDPRTIAPLIRRALLPQTSPVERYYLLNASAYILGVGDVLLLGRGGDLDSETVQTASGLLDLADSAAKHGLGMEHARRLRALANADSATKAEEDYGLALWHESAYLICSLDLRSDSLLEGLLDPRNPQVFQNVAEALALSSGDDVIAPLLGRRNIPRSEEQAAANRAKNWWHAYLHEHPDGDWRSGAWGALDRAGYHARLQRDTGSSVAETLLAATRSHDRLVRYAAYRLLNDRFQAVFDLDPVFCSGKYAMSFRDPEGHEEANENLLRAYWEKRLSH